jgi:uncharacterized membrane protein
MKHRRNYQRGGQRRHNNNRPPREGQENFQNRGSNFEGNRERSNVRPIVQSVLPSPEILQEYEYASEGTVARLLEMAESEQDRRNAWENEYLRFHKKSLRLGQLFGFLLLVSVIWGTIYLGSIGQEKVAMVLAVSGFAAVAASSLFSEIGRRLSRRPRMDRR